MRGAITGGVLGLLICLPFLLAGGWLMKNDLPAIGIIVVLLPTIVTLVGALVRNCAAKRRAKARAQLRQNDVPVITYIDEHGDVWSNHPWSTLPPGVQEELDQTPAWWDREYDRLLKKQIPRDWAYHQDHDLDEPITFYAAGYEMQRRCLDCGVTVEMPR